MLLRTGEFQASRSNHQWVKGAGGDVEKQLWNRHEWQRMSGTLSRVSMYRDARLPSFEMLDFFPGGAKFASGG